MWKAAKTHMKRVAGTCVPSGKGFFQFMVENMCPFRVAFSWGKIWLGLLGVVAGPAFLGGKASGGKVDGTRAARCREKS